MISVDVKHPVYLLTYTYELLWPSSKALGWKQKGLGSIPLWLSFLFKKAVVCGHCLVTLSLTINETLKWLSLIAAHLNAGVILVVSVSPQVYNLPLPPQSLISLMFLWT